MKKCPRCKESVKAGATLCRYCSYQFDSAELTVERRMGWTYTGIKLAVTFVAVLTMARCVANAPSSPTTYGATSTPSPSNTAPVRSMSLKRFSWENESDRNCHASGKFQNTGDETLKFTQITLQFLKNGKLQASDTTYLDVTNLEPGKTSTYSAVYDCPGKGTKVDISAVARGEGVSITD